MSASAMSSGRARWAELFLGLFGLFGAHRFYLGRYQSGIVMCLTMLAGIFFPLWAGTGKMETIPAFAMLGVILWWAVDVIRIRSGGLTDAEGMRLGWRAGPAPVPERSRQVATFLVLLGPLGAHRFYLGQIWYGLLMLFTFGGYGVIWLIDLWLVLSGRVRDKERRALRSGAPVPSPAPATALLPSPASAPPQVPAPTPRISLTRPPRTARAKSKVAAPKPAPPAPAVTSPPPADWVTPPSAPAVIRFEPPVAPPPSPPPASVSPPTALNLVKPAPKAPPRPPSERRLPVYLLIDRSASMRGEPIASVNNAVRVLLGALRQDPYALETAHMSVLGYAGEVTEIAPLTPIDTIQVPEITVPRSGAPHLGGALETLAGRVTGELRRGTADRKGDWSPSLILMTRGRVADRHLFAEQAQHLRTLGFSQIIGCLTGPNGKGEDIAPLCDHVVALDTMDSAGFASLFRWVSSSIATVGRQAPGSPLPAPPREIRLVM
jgi:uncharacterized protein YegL/TM2 domain-containing membrane protein YozV